MLKLDSMQMTVLIFVSLLTGFAIGVTMERNRSEKAAIEAGVAGYNQTNAVFQYYKAK
jgi:hypothetical protein